MPEQELADEGSEGRLPLRVLIADQNRENVAGLARTIAKLGHQPIAKVADLEVVGAITASEQPDVVFVVAGLDTEHTMAMIKKVVHEAVCPVIMLVNVQNPDFLKEAAKLGVFAYISKDDCADEDEFHGSIEIVLCRFAEYQSLESSFARRAVTERAKGVLMERHGIGPEESSDLLQANARRSGRKVVDIAEAILVSHRVLPRTGFAH